MPTPAPPPERDPYASPHAPKEKSGRVVRYIFVAAGLAGAAALGVATYGGEQQSSLVAKEDATQVADASDGQVGPTSPATFRDETTPAPAPGAPAATPDAAPVLPPSTTTVTPDPAIPPA